MADPVDIAVRDLTGEALAGALDALADLRITVFRSFPYLYDGDRDYERTYLDHYARSAGAIIIGAFDGDRLIGAATAAPMADHAAAFAQPFHEHGLDIGTIYYFGESVLLPAYRGLGIGHRFFDAREARARALGFRTTCFCAVMRAADHPDCPADYSPLDPFWRKRGYVPFDGLIATLEWKDVGDRAETPHPMQFWLRTL